MTVKRTTCPFCRNGCESGVSHHYQYRMEYVADARVNRGRLCPRGNSASIVLDHPKRLAYPLLDGREITWPEAIATIRAWIANAGPEQTAVVYTRGLGLDETRLVCGLARTLGTKNLVCGYVEPDNCFNYRLEKTKDAKLEQVQSVSAMLLVGDVFSTSPVAAGPLTEARYQDRKHRLVVIDSFRTRQAGFAHQFIQVRPGTEGFALLALAGLLGKTAGIDPERYSELAGVHRVELEQAAKTLVAGPTRFVGCAMHPGRVKHPVLVSLAAQLVAAKLDSPFTGFGEALMPLAPIKFSEFRQACAEARVRLVLWFGGMHPYSYPALFPEVAKVEFRAVTSIFRPAEPLPGLVLPVPSELEKESRGRGYWGEFERHPLAAPYSGTKLVGWIIEQLGFDPKVAAQAGSECKPSTVFTATEVAKLGNRYADGEEEQKAEDELLLVGEKAAFGIGGFFTEEDDIALSPQDARRFGLADDEQVRVTTGTGSIECRVRLSQAVPAGVAAIGVNAHKNRALFPLLTDPVTSETEIPPVAARLEKVGRSKKLALEAMKEA
ncbi:MAG: molybdopterin dinucleotide binding domain-containing protein [candidate division WOR-3 bacterium]